MYASVGERYPRDSRGCGFIDPDDGLDVSLSVVSETGLSWHVAFHDAVSIFAGAAPVS